ncbi:MAG: hypothetical protein AAFN30_15230 [Actinomycetota bacterium]
MVGGSSIPASPATDDAIATPRPGSRTALVEELEELAEPPADAPDPITAEGTDSVTTTAAPAAVDPVTRDRLAAFGRLYLEFDHRLGPEDRASALAPLVTPPLLADLVAPLPAALVEELAAEERVSVPALVAVEPLGAAGDGQAFRLTYEVTTTVRSGKGEPATTTDVAVLTVVTDADGLVEDVR